MINCNQTTRVVPQTSPERWSTEFLIWFSCYSKNNWLLRLKSRPCYKPLSLPRVQFFRELSRTLVWPLCGQSDEPVDQPTKRSPALLSVTSFLIDKFPPHFPHLDVWRNRQIPTPYIQVENGSTNRGIRDCPPLALPQTWPARQVVFIIVVTSMECQPLWGYLDFTETAKLPKQLNLQ